VISSSNYSDANCFGKDRLSVSQIAKKFKKIPELTAKNAARAATWRPWLVPDAFAPGTYGLAGVDHFLEL
jgi:hypothetical protein